MATSVTWTANADGNWDTAANWSTGTVPDSTDNVTISTSSFHTITHDTGADTVNQLTVGNDLFALGGGSLNVLTTASFADGFHQSGGVFSAGVVAVHGGVLTGGSTTGTTTLDAFATTAIGNYTVAGSAIFYDLNTTNQTAQITVGDTTGTNATIHIAAGAHYNITGDYGITNGATSAEILNSGVLAKTNGSGTSNVGISIVSNGTLSAAAGGTLEFDGTNNTIAGALTGPGAIAFGGASNTRLTVGTISVASLQVIDGASLTIGTSTVLNGVLTEAASFGQAVINVGANTLTIAGAGSSVSGFEGASTITGSGVFANTGSLSLSSLTLGSTVTLSNTGTIAQTGGVTIGDSSGALAQISNAAGGIYDFVQDVNIGVGANTGAALVNAGLLEKTVSTGTSSIAAAVSNAAGGTIMAATGTLSFSNTLANAGTITGAGHVQLVNSAQATLAAGTMLTVAEFDVLGNATLTLGTSLAYGGIFTEAASFGQALLALGANTLTLSGASNVISGFEGASTISGSGEVVNSGTLSVGQLTLGGTATLDNTGTVNQAGGFTLGDSAGNTAIVDNAAKAVWKLINNSGISAGASSLSTFENFGTLTAVPGSGAIVTVAGGLINETGGTVTIGSGTLDVSGSFTNKGLVSGGTLQVTGGVTTLTTGTSMTNTETDLLNGATLNLGVNLNYRGIFNDSASFGQTTINLAGHAFGLSGPTTFSGFEGAARIIGGGTLTTTGTVSLGSLIVGGTSVYSNAGTINAIGNVTVGDGSGMAASVVNAAKGVYDFVNDSGIGVGASMASVFTNNGLFEKTAGTGTSVVSDHFVNSGTITVTSGTIEFTAGTLVNNGSINGVITTDNSGNVFITHH